MCERLQTSTISTIKRVNNTFGKLPRKLMQRTGLVPKAASLPQSPSAYKELDEAAQEAVQELELEQLGSDAESAVGGCCCVRCVAAAVCGGWLPLCAVGGCRCVQWVAAAVCGLTAAV